MFPLTHVYFSSEVLGKMNNMTALGAIFPDITISGILNYDKTHREGWGIYNHFKLFHPEYMDFVTSLITHTVYPKGLDYYGDEQYLTGYKGYCFQKGKSIETETIKVCNLPIEYGLWKAHNIIEMAIELIINEKTKKYNKALSDALTDKNLLQTICSASEDFYHIEKDIMFKSIEKYNTFVELNNLSSLTLAMKYSMQMKKRHDISIQINECAKLIEESKSLVDDDLDLFFNYSIEKVQAMMIEEKIYGQ